MSEETSLKKYRDWCVQAKKLIGGTGAGSGALTGQLKALLDGKRPSAIPEETWNGYQQQIKDAIESGELSDDDISDQELKDVAGVVSKIGSFLNDKAKIYETAEPRMKQIKLTKVGRQLVFASKDIPAALTDAENLMQAFNTQVPLTLRMVEKICTPPYGEQKPSEISMEIWEKTDGRTYQALPKEFVKVIADFDLKSARAMIIELTELSDVFAKRLAAMRRFMSERDERYEGDDLVAYGELYEEYKATMLSCKGVLSGDMKEGKTKAEIARLAKRFELGEAVFKKTALDTLSRDIAYKDDATIGSLKYFVAIETEATAAAEPKITQEQERAWNAVMADVDRQYTRFKNSDFQNRQLRGVWIDKQYKSDFMKKRFKLGRRYNIGGVVYAVALSDSGSTAMHAPIPKDKQWYNAQGKLAKSFIYHY